MSHCDDALRKIGKAIISYQKGHDNQNPPSLHQLVEIEALTPWDLVCPASTFGVGECSYEYRGADLENEADPEMILAYDKLPNHKGRRNILFADGQVKRPPEKFLKKFIDKDNQIRRQLQLTEKPA